MRNRGLPSLAAAALLLSAGAAAAQGVCEVADPTGTPLNIRIEPNGRIVGTIRNGTPVVMDGSQRDERGRVWVFIRSTSGTGIGWVYRNFVAC